MSYLVEESDFARAQVTKIRARFGEAQSAVRPAAYFIGIMVILAVIFPEANRADFVMSSPVQGLEPATRAFIRLLALPGC